AVGFRQNRVSQPDMESAPRELLIDNFSNWGAEARILTRYAFFDKESVLLLGSKYYDAANQQQQGPGSATTGPDFNFATREFPNYSRQSQFEFPNRNLAFFGENIFNLSDEFSVTPGFRYELISTKADGNYKSIIEDLAGNVLKNETLTDDRELIGRAHV